MAINACTLHEVINKFGTQINCIREVTEADRFQFIPWVEPVGFRRYFKAAVFAQSTFERASNSKDVLWLTCLPTEDNSDRWLFSNELPVFLMGDMRVLETINHVIIDMDEIHAETMRHYDGIITATSTVRPGFSLPSSGEIRSYGGKIPAIKYLRSKMKIGLKDAKDQVEAWIYERDGLAAPQLSVDVVSPRSELSVIGDLPDFWQASNC